MVMYFVIEWIYLFMKVLRSILSEDVSLLGGIQALVVKNAISHSTASFKVTGGIEKCSRSRVYDEGSGRNGENLSGIVESGLK